MTNSKEMYGCDINQFMLEINESLTYRMTGGNMVVAGLMSDAQELIAMGWHEEARQILNRAKAVLFAIMDGQLKGAA